MIFWILFLLQLPTTVIVIARLVKGASRPPALQPGSPSLDKQGKVTVVIPTLNESERITPCLEGIIKQGPEVREILIVDSNSQDGTQDIVKSFAKKDPRIRLITDDPLPADWIGRPWALHTGYVAGSPLSEWFMGLDADTEPKEGIVNGILEMAKAGKYDLITLGPAFILKYPGEIWLQPALLTTFIYRFGAPGFITNKRDKVMANGQLFFVRRSVLSEVNGYHSARKSFCDDVTLARNIVDKGFKAVFLDGSQVLKVRMYEGMRETWIEWGRSLDLKDATSKIQLLKEIYLLLSTQCLPLIVFIGCMVYLTLTPLLTLSTGALLFLNFILLLQRWVLLFYLQPTYDLSQASGKWLYWLSPTADPAAFWRMVWSSLRRPKTWRGRFYNHKL